MSIEIYAQLMMNIKVSFSIFILMLMTMLAFRFSGVSLNSQLSFILKNHKARVLVLLSAPLWVGGLLSAGLYGVPSDPSELYKLYDLLIGFIFLPSFCIAILTPFQSTLPTTDKIKYVS